MEKIQEIVLNVIQELAARKTSSRKDDPQGLLKRILTEKELKHAKLHYAKKGILSLYVDSSSWLYILTLRKKELLTKLKAQTKAIKDIRFRLGEVK